MGYVSGYLAEHIAQKHGVCGRDKNGVYWDYAGIRYYFRDEIARRWFAKATIEGTLADLHQYSHPLSKTLSHKQVCFYCEKEVGIDEDVCPSCSTILSD